MHKRLSFFFVVLVSFMTSQVSAIDTLNVSLVYIGEGQDKDDSSAFKGFKQGIDEANLQGEFLGQKYLVSYSSFEDISSFSEDKPAAIFAELEAESLLALVESHPDIPVFNLTNSRNALRKNCCLSRLFHIIPGDNMMRDAVEQWKKKEPESEVIAQAWHSDFKKYAASQVNKRFKNTYHSEMDDDAWSGWIAAKIIADAIVRTKSVSGKDLTTFLTDKLVIDGAKGVKMRFRENGQLGQTLLLVEEGVIVGEAPVRGVVDQHDLDSLGRVECDER